jgi:molybdopterin-guanine dinucleotide biosynthesis protein A
MPDQITSRISAVIVANPDGRKNRGVDQRDPVDPEDALGRLIELLAPNFDDLIIVATEPLDVLAYDGLIVRPHRGAHGLLGAIQAGLFASRHPQALVTHGRLGYLKPAIVRLLTAASEPRWDLVAVCGTDGPMPFTAVYHKRCLKMMAHPWCGDPQAWWRFLKLVRIREIDDAAVRPHDPDLKSFLDHHQDGLSEIRRPGEKENAI